MGTGESLITMDEHPDLIYNVSWNYNGSLFCTSCKDRRIRVCDPRKNEVLAVSIAREKRKMIRVFGEASVLMFDQNFEMVDIILFLGETGPT